jgi:single-strand DNA-binding protein
MTGDQMNVYYRIVNNNWTDDSGTEHFDLDFLVNEFQFGAPGPTKRAELARRHG